MKKLIINLQDDDRIVECDAKINKPAVRKLYWFCEPVGGKNTPLNFLPLTFRGGFGPTAGEKMAAYTDKNGVCKHNDFQLSVCGLDQFKVSVGLQQDGSDKKEDETYEVWRRIYFSVRHMDAKFLFDFGAIHTEYRKHGIWPEQIAPGGGAAKVKNIPVIRSYDEADALLQPVTQNGLEARIVLVDRIWIVYKREMVVDTTRTRFRVNSFPSSLDINSSWIIWPGSKPATGTVSGKGIGNYDITPHMTRTGDRELTIAIPGKDTIHTPLTEAAGRGDLKYRLTVWFCKVLNGYARSDIGRIVIANRTRGDTPRPVGPRQGTMIHEMGHGLGMVAGQIQEYNEFNGNPLPAGPKTNPTHYQNGGGHCNTAAGGSDPDFRDGTCVMFHYGHDGRKHPFCGSCAPIVKRSNLNRSDMAWP